MVKISAVLCVRNEEKTIGRCLAHLEGIVDEIVVVDGESTDRTVEIAKMFGARVFTRPPRGYPEPDRQYSIDQCTGNWVLLIDSDEAMSAAFLKDMYSLARMGYDAFVFPRHNYYETGKYFKHIHYPDRQLRFFRKDSVQWPEGLHPQPESTRLTKIMEEPYYIDHYGPLDEIQGGGHKRFYRYIELQAKLEPKKHKWLYPFKGVLLFGLITAKNIVRGCYLDGVPGIKAAYWEALYYLLWHLKVPFVEESEAKPMNGGSR